MKYEFAYLMGSLFLAVIWLGLFIALPKSRKKMIWVSFLTLPLGLTEPIFVPRYWVPPTLFDLADTYRIDLESFIFSFAIGGVASVIYETISRQKKKMSEPERHLKMHRFHRLAVLSPLPVFVFLYWLTDMNPIYSTLVALATGIVATKFCRPDLKSVMVRAAIIFTVIYFLIFWVTFVILTPGYVTHVWKLSRLSGILILGVPLEELLFAAALGGMWSSLYEHLGWYKYGK